MHEPDGVGSGVGVGIEVGVGVGTPLPPTNFSDIFGGTMGAIFPEWASLFCEASLHLQPVAVHL